jgi:bifunctional ADP-heptose synthase (sugar kinase/adenylyltransferase)
MTAQQKQFKVLVIGDACIDRYVITNNTRTNPEASSLLLNYVDEFRDVGMVYNVSQCTSSLGISTSVIAPDYRQWGTKTRYVDKKTSHILFRVDEEEKVDPIKLPIEDINEYDAVVISDYCKGFITYDTLDWVCANYDGPIFLDTKKKDIAKYSRCFIKINEHEANAIDNMNLTVPTSAIVTLGEQGVIWYGDTWPAYHTMLVDVCGAGDAFLAGLVYGFLVDEVNMIEHAVVNAGISVQHLGVYAPSKQELEVGLQDYALQCGNC